MKLHLSQEEFQDAVKSVINTVGTFGNRKVESVTIPNQYSSTRDVVIEFEDVTSDDSSVSVNCDSAVYAAPPNAEF